MPNQRGLTFSSTMIMLARAVAYACSLALPLVLVRVFSLHEFGIYKQLFVAVNTLMGSLPVGFFMSVYYYLPRDPSRRQNVIHNVFFFNLVMGSLGCVALVLFPEILGTVFGEKALIGYAPIIGIIELLWMSGNLFEAITLAQSDITLSTSVIVGIQLFRTLSLLGAAVLTRSVKALLIVAIVQGALQMGILTWYLATRFPGFWKAGKWSLFYEQLLYSLPYGLSGLTNTLTSDVHNYFVSHTYGTSLFAIYSTGCFQLPFITVLGESVNAVLMPRISQLQGEGRNEEIVTQVARAVRKLALVYMPFFFYMLLVAGDFITALFTKTFVASIPVLRVNLGLILVNLLIVDPVARAYSQFRLRFLKFQMVMLVILTTALWFGVKPLGLSGTVGLVVLGAATARLGLIWILSSGLGLGWDHLRQFRDTVRVAAAAAAAGAVGLLASWAIWDAGSWVRLAALGIVYGVSYFVFLVALRIPYPEEWELFWRWMGKLRQLGPRPA
jgi:O-antigen/teichoic acid export membrane protein